MQVRDKLYIDGQWLPSTGTGTIDVICSSTEEIIGKVPDGTAADADAAVRAAAGCLRGLGSDPCRRTARCS